MEQTKGRGSSEDSENTGGVPSDGEAASIVCEDDTEAAAEAAVETEVDDGADDMDLDRERDPKVALESRGGEGEREGEGSALSAPSSLMA